MDVCIIIPSLNPDSGILNYIKELIENGFKKIILIDDGSREEYKAVFEEALKFDEVVLLTHSVNMGKGRALKDAFNYYYSYIKNSKKNTLSNYRGVITVDSDGQHSVEDVIRLKETMESHPEALVLGCRDFDESTVPPKSKIGNKLTRIVLKLLIGGDVSDTQTGLRGIPDYLLEKFMVLYGERFEYETTMLIESIQSKIEIQEVKIKTIYINDNRETHFDPISDSIAIYRLIFSTFFKYIISSLSSFVVDYGLFCLLMIVLSVEPGQNKIWVSTIIARIFSSFFNYIVNKKLVFGETNGRQTIVYYYILCICQMLCSAYGVALLSKLVVAQISKIIVDTCLFLISFKIQRSLIFRGGR